MLDLPNLFVPLLKIVMISLRMGALWFVFPVLGQASLPPFVRLAGALTVSAALLPVVGPKLPNWSPLAPPALGEMMSFVAREMIIGIGMGLSARWMFSSCVASADWLAHQIGFSAAGLMDPTFEGQSSSWSEFNGWIALMIFVAIGGHSWMIEALATSYKFTFTDFFARLTDQGLGFGFWSEVVQNYFTWMLRLAGPVLVVVLMLQAAMGVLSKFIPQLNVWMVSIPITLGVSVFVFTLLSPMYGDALSRLFVSGRETHYLWLKYLGAR